MVGGGIHGRGACVAEGILGRGCRACGRGACVVGGMHGREVCMAGGMPFF